MSHRIALLALLVILHAGDLSAHHSRAHFDTSATVTVSGIVEEYSWKSPHIYVRVRVPVPGAGKVMTRWLLEGNSPAVLRSLEWDRDALQPGMQVTATGNPARETGKRVMLVKVIEINASGRRLFSGAPDYRAANADKLTAVTIEPSTDFQGIWSRYLKVPPTEAGVFDPPTDFPVTAAGQALLDAYDPDENPALYCVYGGVPRGLNYAYGLQIRREGEQLIFDKELRPDNRVVHLGKTAFPDDIEPGRFGYAIGSIDGNTLTIESKGFLPEKWGIAIGLDSSSEKTVTETWTLVDGGMGIEVEFVVHDPVYLTDAVTVNLYLRKQADRVMSEETCDREQAARFRAEDY